VIHCGSHPCKAISPPIRPPIAHDEADLSIALFRKGTSTLLRLPIAIGAVKPAASVASHFFPIIAFTGIFFFLLLFIIEITVE
jgi:hypothetical protein